ncbi:hydrogenase maturation protease [Xiamenia xianingshaonis]|nr:hydrogenase maturation protease [Xiamenia xianingshaonis]
MAGQAPRRIAVFCVGNKLMLDDGLGPAVYEELERAWTMPDNVDVFDVGCLTMDLINVVDDYDVIVTVDAVDGTGDEAGTVYRFEPDAMARHSGATASLHDLKLVDLFDAATLLGYECEGLCLGMQIENASPSELVVGLTPKVAQRLPFLVDVLVGELARLGSAPVRKDGGTA